MTDIDFDELDRAVSSLMDQHSNQGTDQGAAPSFDESTSRSHSTTVANRTDSVADATRSSAASAGGASTPSAAADAATSSTPTPVAAPIQRRAGRVIMDVVPPTNRTAPARPMATKSPSREGAAITPAEDVRGDEASAAPVQPPTPSADLDLNLEAGVPLDNMPVQPESDFTSPLESPFIEGVSVDKRPLGQRISDEELAEKLQFDQPEPVADAMPDPISFEAERSDTVSDAPVEDIHSHVMGGDPWFSEGDTDNTLTETPLRPELQPDILAVEAASIPDPTTSATPASAEPKLAPEAPAPASPVASGTKDVGPSTPGDIRPQYTAEPSDAPEPGGIFEAAVNAPQPLKHPEKKRSGWLAVVWILLLVVLGAGGGAIAWYFLLQ